MCFSESGVIISQRHPKATLNPLVLLRCQLPTIDGYFLQSYPGWWFQPTPPKNMRKSVGIMTFPTEWKVIKFHGSKPPTSIPYRILASHTPANILVHRKFGC